MQTLLLQSVSDEKSTKLQDLLTPQHRVVCTGCNLRATSEREELLASYTPAHHQKTHSQLKHCFSRKKKIYIYT